jgi:outer membrane protein, adhesin transport system
MDVLLAYDRHWQLRGSIVTLWRLGVSVIALGISWAGPAAAMSLSEAVSLGVATHPNIEAAQASRRASDYQLMQAQGRFLPEIDVNADVGKQQIDQPEGFGPDINDVWRQRKQGTVTFRQILFDGFDRANDLYRSQARISASSHKIMVRSESVALDVVESYIDVVRHRDLLVLATRNVDRHVQLLNIIRERFDGGRASIGDVQQTEERLDGARALVAEIAVAYGTARARFKAAVGDEPGELKQVAYAKGIPGTMGDVVAIALSKNPRLKAANAEIEIAGFDKEQFKSTLYPTIALEGLAKHGENLDGTPGPDEELMGIVTLNWKVFDGNVRRNRVNELSEREAEKVAEQRMLVREIEEQVGINWARLTEGRKQVAAITKQVERNEQLIKTYLDEYNAGRRNLLDLLDAENTHFLGQFDLSNTNALYKFSSYQLLGNMGTLLEYFGVTPPAGADDFLDEPNIIGSSSSNSAFTIPPLRDAE